MSIAHLIHISISPLLTLIPLFPAEGGDVVDVGVIDKNFVGIAQVWTCDCTYVTILRAVSQLYRVNVVGSAGTDGNVLRDVILRCVLHHVPLTQTVLFTVVIIFHATDAISLIDVRVALLGH